MLHFSECGRGRRYISIHKYLIYQWNSHGHKMLGIPLSIWSAPPPQASQKMSSSWSFVPPTLQSSFLLPRPQLSPSFHPNFKWNRLSIRKNKVTLLLFPTVRYLALLLTSFVFAQLQAPRCVSPKTQSSQLDKFALLLQYGAILAAVSPTSLGYSFYYRLSIFCEAFFGSG